MSRKYPSMQDELAARKAAGEYGDLSQFEKRLYRNEPAWAKKSREDYERSRRISNNGAGQSGWSLPEFNASGKWSLRGKKIAEKRAEDRARREAATHSEIPHSGNAKWSLGGSNDGSWTEAPSQQSGASRQESSARKQKTPKIPKQKANRRAVAAQRPRTSKAGCLVAIAIIFVIIPMISAIIAVFGDIVSDFGTDYTYDYEYTDGSYEATGELDEYSSYSEAESYIKDNTETTADDDTLVDWYYGGGYYDVLGDTDFCDVMDGRLYIWAECSEDDDPAEVVDKWLGITNQYKQGLADAGIGDVPVGVIVKESESWDLKLVIIDGVIHFASGDYEDLGE